MDPAVTSTTRVLHPLSRRDFVQMALAAATTPALAACDSPTEPASPRLTARPGEPSIAPVTGITDLGLGGSRDGFLYVPESYDPAVPTPLFVALHGAGQSSDLWLTYLSRAESRAMILLVPESRGVTWDLVSGGLGPDVAFLDRALAHTFDRCRIDASRTCLAGFSDGASYALSLGLSNGDLFTHLIGYSPGFVRAKEPVVGRPSIFVSHGRSDPVLPVTRTREIIVPTLIDAGYDVTYREFMGGHEVPAEISVAALDWFVPTA